MTDNLEKFREFLWDEELSGSTIESYCYSVNDFFSKYDELSKENIITWKNELLHASSPKTVNLRLCGIEKYSAFKNLDFKIKRVRVQKNTTVENVLSINDFQKLIGALEADGNYRWKCYYLILGKTGCRINEALRFKKSDLERGFAQLLTKGKVRKIVFPKSLIDDISEFYKSFQPHEYLIQSKYNKSMTSRGFAVMMQKHASIYGLPADCMHPHSLRHMFAIEFLKRNSNISLLADLLGHSNVNTTMIYLRMSQEDQKNAIDDAVNW
jgi:integrase